MYNLRMFHSLIHSRGRRFVIPIYFSFSDFSRLYRAFLFCCRNVRLPRRCSSFFNTFLVWSFSLCLSFGLSSSWMAPKLVSLKRWQTAAEVTAHRKAQAKYQKDPTQVQKRENRNEARRSLEKEGKAHVGDGKDVMHKNGNALDNSPINWKLGSRHKNRSYKRTSSAHKQDPHS